MPWPRAATSSSRSTSRAPGVIQARVPDALLIFVVPPSLETLVQRLKGRATETDDQLEQRLRNAADRAGPPARLRLRRGQRDRPGGPDRRADRRDHRPRGSPPRGAPGPDLMTGAAAARAAGRGRDRCGRAAGARTYTYTVPAALADLQPGEAVLVEYGRRQALGVVLGEPRRAARRRPEAQAGRSNGSGPTGRSCRRSASSSPAGSPGTTSRRPAFVLRAMLPPGMLERLELVAEARPVGPTAHAGAAARTPLRPWRRLMPAAARPARRRPAGRPRPGRPRGPGRPDPAAAGPRGAGRLDLDWTLTAAAGGPRYERWVLITPAGRAAAAAAQRRGAGSPGDRSGRASSTSSPSWPGSPAGSAGGRSWPGAMGVGLAGLVRRGLVAIDVRERAAAATRRPAAGRRGAPGPAASSLTRPQAEAVGADPAGHRGRPTPRRSCSTA